MTRLVLDLVIHGFDKNPYVAVLVHEPVHLHNLVRVILSRDALVELGKQPVDRMLPTSQKGS